MTDASVSIKKPLLACLLAALFSGLTAALLILSRALNGLSFSMLLFHLRNSEGEHTNFDVVYTVAQRCLRGALLAGGAVLLAGGLLLLLSRTGAGARVVRLCRALPWLGGLALAGSLVWLVLSVQLPQYISGILHPTTLYEDAYVDPRTQNIRLPEDAHNLLHIYVESGEKTCADPAHGGHWSTNLIPGLTRLAEENVSFSDFHQLFGCTWTAGALVAQTTGLPLRVPMDVNTYGKYGRFLPGVWSLGDILAEAGYRQLFMCGSDSAFGGRDSYFQQHGDYEIFDYYTALKTEHLPQGYSVFWGYEDEKLFAFAQEKLLELAHSGEKFNFTMLTVDTHFYDGYRCPLCGSDYPTQYENVIACADSQLTRFLDWVQQQPFYANTTVVITGDHTCMDNEFYSAHGVAPEDRRIYNCILNPAVPSDRYSTQRSFSSYDIFPTTLAAMGAQWNGDRLGLGTNLFSETETLVESMGLEALDRELSKTSAFYEDVFLYDEAPGN